MDDYTHSVDTIEKAITIRQQIEKVLAKGGFELAKWNSNCNEVLRPSEGMQTHEIDDIESTSILGLIWEPATDCLRFK